VEVFLLLTNIWVGNTKLAVDIVEELMPYFDSGYKVRWTEEKLSSPSPFRYDKSPSFFVNLVHLEDKETAGTWIDSGASEGDEYRSGKLEKLLAFLRGETVEETILYLREKYGVKDYDKLTLNLDFRVKKQWTPLEVQGEDFALEYMEGRGIANKVTARASVMDLGDRIAIHWFNPAGQVIAIKYRRKDSKIFSYEEGGKRLNENLYNIQRLYESKFTSLWICEGEIDALSVESTVDRWVGVAIGGAYFKDRQRDLILRAGIPNVVIATDNDKQGEAIATVIREKLEGYVNLYRANLTDCKDVNEFTQKYGKLPRLSKLDSKPLFPISTATM
jgi:5S rRNA maturation endonuclease (ribonuclease M5)